MTPPVNIFNQQWEEKSANYTKVMFKLSFLIKEKLRVIFLSHSLKKDLYLFMYSVVINPQVLVIIIQKGKR